MLWQTVAVFSSWFQGGRRLYPAKGMIEVGGWVPGVPALKGKGHKMGFCTE